MTDRERHDLRGPVRSVRAEHAEFNREANDWKPFRQMPTVVFDVDGNLEGFVRDTAGAVSTTDERGLRTTVDRWGPRIDRPPGLEWSMSVDPARLADVLTRYDASNRPVEIVYRTAAQTPLHRIQLAYDSNGRLARERVVMEDFESAGSHGTMSAGDTTRPSPQEQRELTAALKAMMPEGIFMTREYEYDDRGRVSELRTTNMGLAEQLQVFTYDHHDNVVEEHTQEASREGGLDGSGRRRTFNDTSSQSWNRHQYLYDEHGNWIERITLQRMSSDRDFRRAAITRRTLTYF